MSKKEEDIQKALGTIQFRAECGPGWKKLWEPLAATIIIDGGEILQIKEKFGGLRFYYSSPTFWGPDQQVAFNKRVSDAEGASVVTCEACGEPGKVGGSGWARTLCAKHTKEQEEERKFYEPM